MDDWVQQQYLEAYCGEDGRLIVRVIDLDAFREDLKSQRPEEAEAITRAIRKLDIQICSELCRDLPLDAEGRFLDAVAARTRLSQYRPDLNQKKWRKAMVKCVEQDNMTALRAANEGSSVSTPVTEAERQLYLWIQAQYHSGSSFKAVSGFIGWKKFQKVLVAQKPQQRDQIISALGHMRTSGHTYSFESPVNAQLRWRATERAQGQGKKQSNVQSTKQEPQVGASRGESCATNNQPNNRTAAIPNSAFSEREGTSTTAIQQCQTIAVQKPYRKDSLEELRVTDYNQDRRYGNHDILSPGLPKFTFTAGGSSSPVSATQKNGSAVLGDVKELGPTTRHATATADHLVRNVRSIRTGSETPSITGSSSEPEISSGSSDEDSVPQSTPRTATPDFALYSSLLTGKKKSDKTNGRTKGSRRDIEQAPLLSGGIVAQRANELVPQFGLIGCLANEDASLPSSQLFFNTNVPVSTFICGVQGSGKSHTTSCILENAVIPSPYLGKLESPVSTLVFSYGEWSSGGAGFNISEATFLAAPSKATPGHQVKRITVLTSPSNLAINRLYQKHPNVRIIPFRLRAKTLDISALRTLMAIDEKSSVPLYMAKVESILRAIASKSEDGSLDYIKFKQVLKLEYFNPEQTNMLEMRLNLLESFLDLTDKAPQPDFLPGEITIMDLSDAFISPNTACILFKLGLEHFLQCSAPGKLVVLDEAHKYMLNTPGSKVLTEYLTRVIRLQRHLGARVVISTQEPTVSTDLIALCSVTVIHRFTSPAWYNALKKHINAMDDDDKIMHDIEGLETGEAIVYAPNAVLDRNEDGTLVKATGCLLRLNIRDRVTLDGGESIMAV